MIFDDSEVWGSVPKRGGAGGLSGRCGLAEIGVCPQKGDLRRFGGFGGLSPKEVGRAGCPEGVASPKLGSVPGSVPKGERGLSPQCGAQGLPGKALGQIASRANVKSFSGGTSRPMEGDSDEDVESAFG